MAWLGHKSKEIYEITWKVAEQKKRVMVDAYRVKCHRHRKLCPLCFGPTR